MRNQKPVHQTRNTGFTLIEMLIAVGLLVLMMSIFAQIFALATESMVRQRGIGQNDQKARGLFITIDGDLKKISYSALTGEDGIIPMLGDASDTEYPPPGMMSTDPPWEYNFSYDGQSVDGAHRGYFYISENDPNDDTDDVLQFTVYARRSHPRNRDDTPYYGKAVRLSNTANDQPDMDDGNLDGASQSDTAEISYFMRGGKLYRRVVLVRDPLLPNADDANVDDEAQPNGAGGGDLMGGYGANNFYRNFDFSANYDTTLGHAQFHGTLSNDPGVTSFPLGRPSFRFGFHHADGRPMEYYDGSSGREFLGRHLHAETSHVDDGTNPDFDYPQVNRNRAFLTGNGMADLNSQKIIPTFTNGSRPGEDILMTNVLSFDVRVWDEIAQSYVNIGYDDSTSNTHFGASQRYEFGTVTTPGPNGNDGIKTEGYGDRTSTTNAIFDTWHPGASVTSMDTAQTQPITQPMYRPLKFTPVTPVGSWTDRSVQAFQWTTGDDVSVSNGDIVIPSETYYTNTNAANAPLRANRIPDEFRGVIAFRAIVTGTSEQIIASAFDYNNEPDWETATSLVEYKSNGYETNRITDPNNSNVQWEPIFNLQPLKSMVIRIRFRDTGSDQVRQVTIVHTFAR